MLILGGTGRLYGGIVGAIIFMIAQDQLSGMNPQYWHFWIGLLLMVIVLFMPSGILGGLVASRGKRELTRGDDDAVAAHRGAAQELRRARGRARHLVSSCRAARATR